jgi:hypothetical protein
MSNVQSLPGVRPYSGEPNFALVDALRDLLTRAECGQLRSMVGTGFMLDGTRMAVWADAHDNVYEMLGALVWLQAEYVHRHTEGLK